MSIIADTSYIFALYNPYDQYHDQAVAFASNEIDPIILPIVLLPELGFLFKRDFGYSGVVEFLDRFKDIESRIETMRKSDLQRVFEIAQRYPGAPHWM